MAGRCARSMLALVLMPITEGAMVDDHDVDWEHVRKSIIEHTPAQAKQLYFVLKALLSPSPRRLRSH